MNSASPVTHSFMVTFSGSVNKEFAEKIQRRIVTAMDSSGIASYGAHNALGFSDSFLIGNRRRSFAENAELITAEFAENRDLSVTIDPNPRTFSPEDGHTDSYDTLVISAHG